MNNGEEGPELASRDKREILPYDLYRRPWCGRVIMDFRVMSRLSKGPVTLNVLGVNTVDLDLIIALARIHKAGRRRRRFPCPKRDSRLLSTNFVGSTSPRRQVRGCLNFQGSMRRSWKVPILPSDMSFLNCLGDLQAKG